MTRPAYPWLDACLSALGRLGQHRGCLFLLLLLLNAVARPYAGFVHDSRLYGMQVLNRVEKGAYQDDLFFHYGSQDQYTAFSAILAPLADTLGLPWTFFLVYLASIAILLYGMLRLVEVLIEDRALSTLALIFFAISSLPFGGFGTLNVNENFLTPRLLANGLVLLALAELLQGRAIRSLLFLLSGFLLHPIMALAGLGVYALWQGWERLPSRWFRGLGTTAALIGVGILACPPLAWRLFGHMDAEWMQSVLIIADYNYPEIWTIPDCVGVVVTLALPIAVALLLLRERPRQAHFFAIVSVVAAGGFLATVIASIGGYTLLFQAQPYRALWLVKVLEAPLTILLTARLWLSGSERARLLALVLLGRLVIATYIPMEFVFPLVILPFVLLLTRGLEKNPRRADWLSRSVAVSLVLGFLGWAAFRLWALHYFVDRMRENFELYFVILTFLVSLGPIAWTLLGMSLARCVVVRLGTGSAALAVCGMAYLAVQLSVFLVPRSDFYRAEYKRYNADLEFVAKFLQERGADRQPPTVYWSIGSLDVVWLELGAKSYYDRSQVAGVLFSRGTALEGLRRARVVGAFEVERLLREKPFLTEHKRRTYEALHAVPLQEETCPTRADLARLCRDEAVDYVIVPHRFDGLFAATNGRFYIYDCDRVQAALGTPPSSATAYRSGSATTSRADSP